MGYASTVAGERCYKLATGTIASGEHLTFNSVEVLKNSVSASSAKLLAFNTLSKALEDHWSEIPHTAAGRDEQVKFLVFAARAGATVEIIRL